MRPRPPAPAAPDSPARCPQKVFAAGEAATAPRAPEEPALDAGDQVSAFLKDIDALAGEGGGAKSAAEAPAAAPSAAASARPHALLLPTRRPVAHSSS